MGEDLDLIDITWLAELMAAFAQFGKQRNVAADDIVKIEFRDAAGIVSYHDRRAGNVLKTAVFDPKLIGVVGIDGNGSGHIAEFIVNQGEAGFVFANGRFPLPVEGGVDQRKLPCW